MFNYWQEVFIGALKYRDLYEEVAIAQRQSVCLWQKTQVRILVAAFNTGFFISENAAFLKIVLSC